MNKKGVVVELGIVILAGLLIVGSIGVYTIISENRYVGDKTTLLYYDLKVCDIHELARDNIISFNGLDEAKKNGYKPSKCSL